MKNSHLQNINPSLVIEMSKTPCFGTCPVYNLYIYDNRTVEYQGIKYVDKLGLFTRELSTQQYEGILFAFQEAKFAQMQDLYDGPVSDLPSTLISWTREGVTKTVKARYGIPDQFKNLEKLLHSVAISDTDWRPLENPDRDPNVIANEIIVQLKTNAEVDNLISDLAAYGAMQAINISSSMNMWLIRYDQEKIDAKTMMSKIIDHPLVESAEFNKKVQIR